VKDEANRASGLHHRQRRSEKSEGQADKAAGLSHVSAKARFLGITSEWRRLQCRCKDLQ
jgi:hypothetical protein